MPRSLEGVCGLGIAVLVIQSEISHSVLKLLNSFYIRYLVHMQLGVYTTVFLGLAR